MATQRQDVHLFKQGIPSGQLAPPDGVPAPVLLVDDNPAKLAALATVIDDMGLDVATATSGCEALRLLLQRDFAVILLDVKMPEMDGFETAALIHGRPKSAHTPIIFVTAEASTDSESIRGYTSGAVDYIFSPIVPEVLRAKIRVFVDLFYLQRTLTLQAEELQKSKRLLRELASYQEQIKEEERKRIAREIHDQLGQSLLALRIDISMLYESTSTVPPELNKKMGDVLNHIDTAIRSVRGIINDLRPPVLDLGLQAAIEWQLEEFRQRTGIVCSIRAKEEDFHCDLDDKRATTLFRILQESLSNITRHAQATRVDIELYRVGRQLRLQIKDNGVGMKDVKKTSSFGLVGMKERVSTLGGEFNIDSVPGRGTILTIAIPLD
ncbi:ATP-binding response regulator [Pseudogulbenkiania subflava]|uniref:Oxygen sensor histidine kinase NreB n=1 Tax=Pseudogulbenkiania subflava DSM 22618 TaxID=1123014 RepID=A0A1Y6BGL1_9NEIS|nr:response regulator [Pseudogulbenkiania subflava]SMF10171.1 Histidine kinase-, DNA gyrase B-, and HSP90-like ATPase [Pseudogulbenkiania subflava DSM 22618]